MAQDLRRLACACGVMASTLAVTAADGPTFARVTKYDNVHIRVTDPVAATKWYVAHLGATATGERGAILGETVIAFVKTDTPQPSAGSVIDHIAVSVSDLGARMKQLAAAGVKITAPGTRDASGLTSAFIEDPWGTRIEVLSDPQALGFHHVHLAVPDPEGAIAWFEQMLGGERLTQGPGLRYGSVRLLAQRSAAAAPSADRAIMNVAFRVADIQKAVAELKGKGVKIATEPTAIRDLWYAFLDAPTGVRFELLQRP